MVARRNDRLDPAGIVESLGKIKTRGQESRRRAIRFDLSAQHERHWHGRNI